MAIDAMHERNRNMTTTKRFFAARHSSGSVHLRATNGTGDYKFAVVRTKASTGANFSSRRDLAEREAERQRHWYADVEVVPCVEIDRPEYNALLKAGVIKQAVTFRGKKFTKTTKLDSAWVPSHAVGIYRAAHEVRVEIGADWHQSWHEKHPEGFYMAKYREDFSVCWYCNEEDAHRVAAERVAKGYEVEVFTL